MPAGNVAVSVSGNALYITGDDLSNGVSVQQIDHGKYWVSGFALAGSPTTINGHSGVMVANVVKGVHVALNGGDDVFVMSNSASRRDAMAAELSNGTAGPIPASPVAPASNVNPGATRVYANLSIDGGLGNDGIGTNAEVGTLDANGNTVSGTV